MRTCVSCGRDNQAGTRFCGWCGFLFDGATPTGLLPAQSLLHAGRYLILERVGQGGMGAVYKALDLELNNRVVAIKEMSQHRLTGQELQQAIDAFTREARLLALLHHPNLPHIYQQFEEQGRRYLVMEFIEGETLEQRMTDLHAQKRRLSLALVISIARQLCIVLDYLHTCQPPIIFRDLKPANIMLSAHDQVYLIDFGIARFFKPDQAGDTAALGSPGYAPPEQYRQATSLRSDIYSLGATLHQALTGLDPTQKPFHFSPFSVNLPALERLVLRMVALDEGKRPATMREVLDTLNNLTPAPRRRARSAARRSSAARSRSTAPSVPASISICALVSASAEDRRLWTCLHTQLAVLTTDFSPLHIATAPGPGGDLSALDSADLILLLLSDDFLSSPACVAEANHALARHDAQRTPLLALPLRACQPFSGPLTRITAASNDPIMHPSPYAQEQRTIEAARAIRRELVAVASAGWHTGLMTLWHWLLWQLYADGPIVCPYFSTDPYVLKYLRRAAFDGILISLFDRRQGEIIAEHRIGPLHCPALTALLHTIAPSHSDPTTVQGQACRKNPLFS
jgi:serine/threonine protein kinase